MKVLVNALLLVAIFCGSAAAENLYQQRLDVGLRNDTFISALYLQKAAADPQKAKEYLDQALRLSPDLPAAYFRLAWFTMSSSPSDIFEAANYFVGGLSAYKRNFWWQYNLFSIVYIGIILASFLSVLLVVLIRLPMDLPLLVHEAKENPKNILFIILCLPVSALGPLFFLAAMLIIISLYFRKSNTAITYAFFIVLALFPFLLSPVQKSFSAEMSPELRAIVSVNQGEDNEYALKVLKNRNGREELFSYALAAKRTGRMEAAMESYRKILEKDPDDFQALVNLGNCLALSRQFEDAKALYQKAIGIRPSASAYYNLGQVEREMLNFPAGDKDFDEAKKIDSDAIARFGEIASRSPNRFYVDEQLGIGDFWGYAPGLKGAGVVSLPFVPGKYISFAGIAALLVFAGLSRLKKNRAFACKRCGVVICTRCEKNLKWGSMCRDCFSSLVTLESDPRERIAKVMTVYDSKRKRKSTILLLSLLMPGAHLIYTGKIAKGAVLAFFFLLMPVLIAAGFVYRISIYPFAHVWLVVLLAFGLLMLYGINIIATGRLLKKWV